MHPCLNAHRFTDSQIHKFTDAHDGNDLRGLHILARKKIHKKNTAQKKCTQKQMCHEVGA